MPAIRRKPSEDNASRRGRKPIKTDLDVASRSESNDESLSGVSTPVRGVASDLAEAKPIAINGILLRPTIAFDTFWRFAAERKAIYDRRRAGEPAP